MVDDDDVHERSAFAVRGLRIAGRPLALLPARSAAQALQVLAEHRRSLGLAA